MEATDVIRRDDLGLETAYVAPETPQERAVVEVFETVFAVEGIGLDDDFFDLGGDSLHAEALSVGMEALSGRDFRISDIGDYATPRILVETLGDAVPDRVDRRPIVFLVHGAAGYTMPPKAFFDILGESFRVHVFELPGLRKEEHEIESIPELATHYLGIVQEMLPEGDINLASFCKGSLVAIEMARQSEEKGRRIRSLAMFDPNIKPNVDKAMRGSVVHALSCRNPVNHRWRVARLTRKFERAQRRGEGRFSMLRVSPRAKLTAAFSQYIPDTPPTECPPLVIRTRRLKRSLDRVLSNRIDCVLDIDHEDFITNHPAEIARPMKDYFDDPASGT